MKFISQAQLAVCDISGSDNSQRRTRQVQEGLGAHEAEGIGAHHGGPLQQQHAHAQPHGARRREVHEPLNCVLNSVKGVVEPQ